MKFNVNVEVSEEEIKQYAYEMLLKGVATLWNGMDGVFSSVVSDPQAVAMFQSMIQQAVVAGAQARQRQRGPMGMPGYAPPGYAPPMHGYPGGPPPGYGPMGPGPYAAGPPMSAYPTAAGANGPGGPGAVRPVRPEGAQVEQCFLIEANERQEEGIGCCHCATVNAKYRTTCRRCNHKLCYVGSVVTPAPQGPRPPQVPASSPEEPGPS